MYIYITRYIEMNFEYSNKNYEVLITVCYFIAVKCPVEENTI